MPAETRAVTASAVISPLKSDNCVTSASAFADAFFATAVVAVAVVDAALTTEPSAGKTNDDVVTGCAAGGDADVPRRGRRLVRDGDPDRVRARGRARRARTLTGARRDEREEREQEPAGRGGGAPP